MAATSMVEIELAFQDSTTKKVQIGPFTPSDLSNLKNRAKEFNAAGGGYWESVIANENGAQINVGTNYPDDTPIRNLVIITSTETDVNLYEG